MEGAAARDISEDLGSFLPLELLSRVYRQRGALPAVVEFPAAVIFVDVSRYTAMVEQLAQRGSGGLERIPNLLSRSYARCVEQVYELGGQVLSLAGDTLVAYWPGEGETLGSAVRIAADCAKRICQDRSALVEGAEGEMEPALHVGVGAGRLWAAAVGGQPLWNIVAGGEAIAGAAKAQSAARRWQYALSQRAELELKALGAVAWLEGTAPAASGVVPPDAGWLAAFLPPQLRTLVSSPADGQRRDASTFDALAEIRPITALFARIAGLDYRDPEALARHHQLCVILQEALRARAGPAGELVYDDKGLVFLATFGAHGSFHRDDASRAVDAARAIITAVQGLGLTASIGLATGDALFRVVGNVRRRQLMVMGAPMNRAARLMTSVQGDILCDAPTERASRSAFTFENRGTLQLVGLGDRAAVFRPLEARPTVTARGALIGRKGELDVLARAFDETKDGERRLVVVLGEPGIGKTRLIDAFAEDLRSVNAAVCISRAERDDRSTSLLPWRRVIASLLDLSVDADGFVILERLTKRVGLTGGLAGRLPLLDGILGISIPQTKSTRHFEGPHRADATMRLLGEIIDKLAPRPFVCVLEDSQWLDSASWRLVEWVLASLPSLLLVLCVRSEEVPEELKILRRRAETARVSAGGLAPDDPAHFCRIIDLQELSNDSICELVARTLGQAPPQDALARRIAELAAGNPLFAEEIALTLKSEGLIAVREGYWRPIRSLDDLKYFEGVERVIRERLDRLAPSVQNVVKAAAVVGRSFTAAAVTVLCKGELSAEAAVTAIENLVAANFARAAANSGDYEFRHDKIRDVVYELIPSDVRRRLHGALAEWVESSQAPSNSGEIAALVQHFQAAGNKEKAVKYADLAATQALQTGSCREAEGFLEICLTNEQKNRPTTPFDALTPVRWRRQLGDAHYSLGNIRAQGVAVRRALTLAGESVPPSAIGVGLRVLAKGATLALQQVFPPRPPTKEHRASWHRELTRCLNQAAVVDFFELRFTRAFSNAVAAVTHAERVGLSVERVVASAQLASGLGILGLRSWAGYFMARAERDAQALADPILHAQVNNLDALWRIGHCDWPMVDERLTRSQSLSLAASDQLSWCNAQALRFWSLHYRGDQDALEQTAQELLGRAQNSGNFQQEVWALRCKALCVLHTDKPREAVDILKLIATSTLGSADRAEQVATTGSLSLALARVGLHTESVQTAVETLQLLRTIGRPTVHSTLPGIAAVAEVLLRGREAGLSREYDQWSRWERRALFELKRYSRMFAVGIPQLGLWEGVAHWLDGRTSRAVSTWKRALSTAQRLSLRKDEALIAAEMRRRHD